MRCLDLLTFIEWLKQFKLSSASLILFSALEIQLYSFLNDMSVSET